MLKLSLVITYLQNNLLLACDCLSVYRFAPAVYNDNRLVKHVHGGQLQFHLVLCALLSAQGKSRNESLNEGLAYFVHEMCFCE